MRPYNPRQLGELEGSVMAALWEAGELTTPEIHDLVGRPRGLAYTTILTVLQRLARKGLVNASQAGKRHRYTPALSESEYRERRAESLAEELVGLGSTGVAAFFAEVERLDPEVVGALRRRLEPRP